MRYVLAMLVLFFATPLGAQPPATGQFEVASVKLDPRQTAGGPRGLEDVTLPVVRVLPGGRVESYGHTLRNMIAWALDINTLYQRIEGNQAVLQMEFVISARAAASSLTRGEAQAMVRALLEDRFQLRVRQQPRQVDGYVLTPSREDARPGTTLRPFSGDCDARANNPSVRFDSRDYEAQARCGWTGMMGRQRAVGVSLTSIADRLTNLMAAPVSDGTGWTGLFTFDLTAGTDTMPAIEMIRRVSGLGPPLSSTDAPQLLEVLRTELGLRLVKTRTSVNDFIVERAEPLIEN